MKPEIRNLTIRSLTESDDDGVLSIVSVDGSIEVEFDQEKAAAENDIVSVPESVQFELKPVEDGEKIGDTILEFDTPVPDVVHPPEGLEMEGGVLVSTGVFIFPILFEPETNLFHENSLSQNIKLRKQHTRQVDSEGTMVVRAENDPGGERNTLILANSESLTKSVELAYLIELARRNLSNYLPVESADKKIVSAIEYIAVEVLRDRTPPDPRAVLMIAQNVCKKLDIDLYRIARILQQWEEKSGKNAWEIFADFWKRVDKPGISLYGSGTAVEEGLDTDESALGRLRRLEDEVSELQSLSGRIEQLERETGQSHNVLEQRIDQLKAEIRDIGEAQSSSREEYQELGARVDELRQRVNESETVATANINTHRVASPDDAPDDCLERPWSPPDALTNPEPLTRDDTNLHFPDSLPGTENLFERIHAALVGGKHLILTGPPGSGKTTLAREICERYAPDHEFTTATSDWRTFDTVGGYRQRDDGTLEFSPGVFLRRWSDPDPDPAGGEIDEDEVSDIDDTGTEGADDEEEEQEEPTPAGRNEWLVVDELNRADADQAFGSLFTVLSDETVTLSFDTPAGDPVTVVGDPDDYDGPQVEHDGDEVPEARRSHYFVPESWRLVATANSADKATLYRLSYAFMRRFEFVHVPAPGPETLIDGDEPDSSIVEPYFDYWSDDWRVGFEDATEAILSHAGDSPAAEALQRAIDDETVGDPFDGLDADTVRELVAAAETAEDDRGEKVLRSIFRTVLAEHLARIWAAASSGSRDIGPGIVSDLAEHVLVRLAETGQLTYDQAVAGTLLPQFENRRQELEGFLEELAGVPGFEEIDDGNPDAATAVLAADYLDVDVTPDAGGSDS